jgi:hypothetical protein
MSTFRNIVPGISKFLRAFRLYEMFEIGLVECDIVEAPILEPLFLFFYEIEKFRNEFR